MRRHDAACSVLKEWSEEMHCNVHREVVLPNPTPGRPEARMDLVIHPPQSGIAIHVDLTVVTALSRGAMAAGAARRDGAAAQVAARHKRAKYPNCPVVPFVVEDHGRIGEDALRLVRQLAPSLPSERSAAIRRLYQSFSAVLQRHSADSVLAATAVRRSGQQTVT